MVFCFTLAVPYSFSALASASVLKRQFNILSDSNQTALDSLLAVKHILYEENVAYLVICAIVLLVALIGSAIFTRKFKNK